MIREKNRDGDRKDSNSDEEIIHLHPETYIKIIQKRLLDYKEKKRRCAWRQRLRNSHDTTSK
jgi:hypothetical protein